MKRIALLLLATSTAHAGGTQRPNAISARGVGLGGAWTALADDPTAIYFNPGALDAAASQVMVGGELVIGPRSYKPINGESQDTTIVAPVPTAGIIGRFSEDGIPSRFTLGLGVWNTFGGRTRYEPTNEPALDATQDVLIEVNGAAALHISDRLSIGGALRFGIGMFSTEATMNPFDADVSASGVGLGMTWGALVRPTDALRIGLTWRSPMRITTKGSGTIELGGPAERHDVEHRQNWPQQVSLGIGHQTTPVLRMAAQVDWTQWSQQVEVSVLFPSGVLPDQIYPAYWNDTWTVRAGAEYALSPQLAVRGGAYFDSQAVPDRTLERQYSDSNKVGVSAGTSVTLGGSWRVDAAVDGIVPRTRKVPDNTDETMGIAALRNKAPGEYRGALFTFELAASRQF